MCSNDNLPQKTHGYGYCRHHGLAKKVNKQENKKYSIFIHYTPSCHRSIQMIKRAYHAISYTVIMFPCRQGVKDDNTDDLTVSQHGACHIPILFTLQLFVGTRTVILRAHIHNSPLTVMTFPKMFRFVSAVCMLFNPWEQTVREDSNADLFTLQCWKNDNNDMMTNMKKGKARTTWLIPTDEALPLTTRPCSKKEYRKTPHSAVMYMLLSVLPQSQPLMQKGWRRTWWWCSSITSDNDGPAYPSESHKDWDVSAFRCTCGNDVMIRATTKATACPATATIPFNHKEWLILSRATKGKVIPDWKEIGRESWSKTKNSINLYLTLFPQDN